KPQAAPLLQRDRRRHLGGREAKELHRQVLRLAQAIRGQADDSAAAQGGVAIGPRHHLLDRVGVHLGFGRQESAGFELNGGGAHASPPSCCSTLRFAKICVAMRTPSLKVTRPTSAICWGFWSLSTKISSPV